MSARNNVQGAFPDEIHQQLIANKRLASEIVQDLLNAKFPEKLHREILGLTVRSDNLQLPSNAKLLQINVMPPLYVSRATMLTRQIHFKDN